MPQPQISFIVVVTLAAWVGCAHAPEIKSERNREVRTPESDFRVANWFTTWEGQQPDYPLTNAQGEPIVIRGKEATVGGSYFTFAIQAEGTVQLNQTHDDGRVMDFAGTWKGQTNPDTGELLAIVCDLSALSTGAYRQYALMVDKKAGAVRCHGTSKEPAFVVSPAP